MARNGDATLTIDSLCRCAACLHCSIRSRLDRTNLPFVQCIVRMATMPNLHLRNIDMNLLVPLQALLEERNVTHAGKRVNLSQPAMSRILKRLRDALSDALLIRDGRDYQLTARGQALLQELELMLPRLERLWRGQRFSPRDAKGRIRIIMTDYATAVILPLIIGAVSSAAPGLRIHVSTWQEDAYEDLSAGRADLVFSALAPPPPVHTEVLFREQFICLVSEDHSCKAKALNLNQYLKHGHVMVEMEPNQQTLVDRPLAEVGKRRRIALVVPYFIAGVAALRGTDWTTRTCTDGSETLFGQNSIESCGMRLTSRQKSSPEKRIGAVYRSPAACVKTNDRRPLFRCQLQTAVHLTNGQSGAFSLSVRKS